MIAKLGERDQGEGRVGETQLLELHQNPKYVKKNPKKKKKKNGREDCAKTIELCKRKKTNTKGNVSL